MPEKELTQEQIIEQGRQIYDTVNTPGWRLFAREINRRITSDSKALVQTTLRDKTIAKSEATRLAARIEAYESIEYIIQSFREAKEEAQKQLDKRR